MASKEETSMTGITEGDVPVRGRGGFSKTELRTIPENVTTLRLENTSGCRSVDIVTNYVPITPMPDRLIQMYRVDFEPEVESAPRMRFLFKSAAKVLFQRMPIYDGVHECRSGQKLSDKVTVMKITDPQDKQEYAVKFTNTGTSSYGAESLRTYNMQMKDFLRVLGFYSPQVGLFVNPDHYDEIGTEIMMLRGYRTAANVHDGNKILMNLEASHKLVQKPSVLAIMENLKNEARGAPLPAFLNSALTGKIVVTSYNRRCYRIEEVDFSTKPTSTFDRNGTVTSYVDYYRTVHNKNITSLTQPMLKVVPNNQRRREEGDTRVTILVPELCNMAGLTDRQRTDNRLKMDLIRASQVAPADRVKHMRQFLQTFHENNEIREQLNSWGYSYGTEPCRLNAHVLPMTGYAFANLPIESYQKPDLNTADIRVNSLAVIPTISKMAIITPRNQLQQKGQIMNALKQGFDSVKLAVGTLEHRDMTDGDSPQHYIRALRSLPPDVTFALVIMQQQQKERYDAIKKAASVEKGLITQVVTARLMTDQRKARSAAQKIAIQVAAKLGGEPWWVDIPIKKTMICGYDTYHDTAQRGRSYGAFVASLNMRFSRWWSKSDAHERLDEISTQMSINLTEALKSYRKFNNDEIPERIIIYRDGVGEGQLEHVFRIELQKIKEVLSVLSPKPRLTFIVVNKRIGARFYMRSGADGSFVNPPPGTVIDHTVTRKERFDFYLVSQSTRQGAVTPTYYNIIHDESAFKPEIHQKMAFKLCLLYYNWSGTVRVPAPCQYAHKLALLCGEHIHGQPNAMMDEKLHYL